MSISMTLRLRATRLATTVALVALATVGLTVSAGAAPPPVVPPSLGSALGYAVNQPVCNQPARIGFVRCFAFKRVDVAKGTKHAYSYVKSDALVHGPAGGYTPALVASAYGFDPRVNRSSQTVAIVDWYDDPLALVDLRAFDAHYRFPLDTAATFRKVNQRGLSAPLPSSDQDASTEIALDTQVVRGVCRTCKILLVEADSPSENDIAAAENTAVRLGATVVSNSFGGPEHGLSSSLIAAYNHPGVAITASTGDDGWRGWDWSNNTGDHSDNAVSYPASSPYVVSVGGTSLTLNANGTRANETVWNGNGPSDSAGLPNHRRLGAGGGGCSRYFGAPLWQLHHAGYAAAGCAGKRLSADVSALADPRYGFDIVDRFGAGGWITVGGTSVAAPLVAGMYALVGGAHGAAYPSAAVYTNSDTKLWSRYDVRTGGNGFCGGATTSDCSQSVASQSGLLGLPGTVNNPNALPGGLKDCSFPSSGTVSSPPALDQECNAVVGYDGPSGVGAPSSSSLFLNAEPALGFTHPAALHVRQVGTFTSEATEYAPNTHILYYVWRWGDGARTVATSTSARHAYARTGRFLVTLSVVDSRYQVVYHRTWQPVVT
jgi:hypothetical protein